MAYCGTYAVILCSVSSDVSRLLSLSAQTGRLAPSPRVCGDCLSLANEVLVNMSATRRGKAMCDDVENWSRFITSMIGEAVIVFICISVPGSCTIAPVRVVLECIENYITVLNPPILGKVLGNLLVLDVLQI